MLRWLRALVACLWLSGSAVAVEVQDVVLGAKVGTVDVHLFIPGDAKVLRVMIIHAAHYKLSAADRWAEVCRSLGFADAALNINLKETDRPAKLRKGLDEGLREFAEKAGRRELLNLPFAGVGYSAGGMVSPVILRTPERTLMTCVSCGWIADPAKLTLEAAAVPHAFTLGAIPDDSARVVAASPKADHTLMVAPGLDLVLRANVREGIGVAKVAFYEGDRLLGEVARAPWQLTWKGISQGPHAVWAQWTTLDGKLGASLPALIVVRARPGK